MRLLFILGLLVFGFNSNALKTKGGYFGCVTESLHTQLMQAYIKKDKHAKNYLLKNGCVILRAGLPLSVIDRGFSKSQVRIYSGSDAFVLWTVNENIVP